MNESTLRPLVDFSLLIRHSNHETPTGIDRVELAYANFFAARPGTRFVLQHSRYVRIVNARRATPIIESTKKKWAAPPSSEARDRAFQSVLDWLSDSHAKSPGPAAFRPRVRSRFWPDEPSIYARFAYLLATGRSPRSLGQPTPSLYIIAGQQGLSHAEAFRWLSRQSVPGLFFVHDLIPIEHPQFFEPGKSALHARRILTVKTHANAIIVNSEATRLSVRRYFEAQDWPLPRIYAVPLGIEPVFEEVRNSAHRPSAPYFVVIGSSRPIKNRLMLLHLWRRLVEEHGPGAPRLVLIGRRQNEETVADQFLDRSPDLSEHVIELSGLDDRRVAQILAGARALLMPSFTEGFGIPVAEALAAGVPAIASDVPAHREVGGPFALYLDPLDELGWAAAIRELAAPNSSLCARLSAAAKQYRPSTWDEHFRAIVEIMAEYGR